ncbi:hypothetical protein E2C01_045395 [Portunus trituberculatus]|uniref:Uncharacterized protein n=1 Tax=Portunus trituberculatus TaxID=210409 RepID=A0A5B7G1W5_PORTR|nr:hypothetical protein [Portunus trituberculatus]
MTRLLGWSTSFDKGMQEEDYKDGITARSNNCPTLAPVECNPQIWEALKTDARKADVRLKDVSGDILKADIILTKSLLALDQVAQEDGHPLVEQEVNRINGALVLFGHANHKNNLVRRFVMKWEINQKYSYLCSDKWPMPRMLFGDDVSQSARQIEDMEKLKHKFAAKKNPVPWRFTSGRSRGFWGKSTQDVLLVEVPALWTAEGLQGWPMAITGSSGPRLKKHQGPGSVQAPSINRG